MSSPSFQSILDALDNYTKQTGINLKDDPFADKVKGCDSPGAILRLLEENVKAFKEYRDKNRKFIDCLSPVVQFVHTFSGILGEAAGLVPFQPTKLIFVGIDVLFVAAEGVSASYDALLELFEGIGSFLKRLEVYAKLSLSPLMTDIIVKLMVELVSVLALARKQIKQGRFRQFAKKLLGDIEIESILRRLDRLTQEEARMMDAQILEVVYGLMNNMKVVMDGGEASTSAIRKSLVTMQDVINEMNKINRDGLQGKSRKWLSPPDPSKNQIIARRDNRDGSAVWFTRGATFENWNATGCLLWIHGKPGSGKSILCSTVIQEAKAMCDAGLALVAYFYFDFRDTAKQDIRGLLSSIVTQLSAESDACYNILSDLYSAHYAGSQLPDDEALVRCLKDMLQLPDQPPIFLILDAVDECPDSTGVVSPRERVLGLIEDLVESRLPNLRLCITSRPETDILDVLEPLASHIISLHDEEGQKRDIIDYINASVQSDRKMRRWRAEDRQLVIDALIEKADGMFRWVFCQLEILRRCFPTAIRRALDTLPESLDDTYERILLGIDKEKQKYARRLFQCVTVSIRPLRVEELAEILAVQLEDGQDSEYDTEWRPEDAHQAVLSACSSIITIVNVDGSPVVQFAHFSVKEFLTSDRLRLSAAKKHLSLYHIPLRSAHAVLAQACLLVLLSLDESADKDAVEKHPLALYAARHWVDHGKFEDVSSSIQDLMERLFDQDKPHFATWVWIYDFDHPWEEPLTMRPTQPNASPIYYAAICGLPSVIDHLAISYRGDFDPPGGRYGTALNAASAKGNVDACLALLRYGADIQVQPGQGLGPLSWASQGGHRDVAKVLLEHNVDVDILTVGDVTPLYAAAYSGKLEICRLLLEYGADPNFRNEKYKSPLHTVSLLGDLEIVKVLHHYGASLHSRDYLGLTPLALASQRGHSEVVRFLLECGSDVASRDRDESTPLHLASNEGYLNIVEDLLIHGADTNVQREDLQTPLHLASGTGYLEIVQLLIRHGAALDTLDANAETPLNLALREGTLEIARFLIAEGASPISQDKDGQTPLHYVSQHGDLGIVQVLLTHGVDVNIRNAREKTPLDLASGCGKLEIARFLIERGADVNCRDANNRTPLHEAAANGHSDLLQLLLGTGTDVHVRDDLRDSPLMLASRGGHLDASRVLIEHGADVNTVNDHQKRWTSLHEASSYGHLDVTRLLLDHGANVNVQSADYLWAPLHLASLYGYLELAEFLVECGADIDKENSQYETPLACASRNGHLEVTRFLVHCAANIRSRDSEGRTPLHAAAETGNLGVAKLLLESGANVNERNWNYESPFDLASRNQKHEVASFLAIRMGLTSPEEGFLSQHSDIATLPSESLECGTTEVYETTVDEEEEITLHTASERGLLDIIRSFLDSGVDIHTRNTKHETALHVASSVGSLDTVRLLIDRGTGVDRRDNEGCTALHRASGSGQLDIALLLLDHGADVDAIDVERWTSLFDASRNGHSEIVQLLVERGANVNALGGFGMTPLRVAKWGGHPGIVQLLLEHGARP